MSIANFEGKTMYRVDYTTTEVVSRGDTVTKDAYTFFLAETPEEAIAGVREYMEPAELTVMNVTAAMPGGDLRYKVMVVN